MTSRNQRKRDAERRRHKRMVERRDRQAKQLSYETALEYQQAQALSVTDGNTDVRRALAEKLAAIRKPARTHALAPKGIIWQCDEWDSRLLVRGHIFESESVRTEFGQPHHCEENCAALLWLKLPEIQVATGYAYQNGLWGPHTWIVDGNTIVETTSIRDVYFGVVMDEVEASNFLMNKLLSILQECGLGIEPQNANNQIILTVP